ncbi:hypothetical protein V9T40_013382 [Parthenolecanium corni]|uniref:Uncharacterized protein n=1 Tax=Parthenolecanium corni TaxID=536013 RepID=A0AAN9Y6V4_9HEMI
MNNDVTDKRSKNRANREQSENGGESEEESEVDTHLLLRRINEQLSQQREEGNGTTELKFDDLRRLYELNNNNSSSNNNNNSSNNNGNSNSSNNNGHIPEAHRPPSGSTSLTSNSPFSAFTQQFPSDRDRLMQFHINNYLSNPSYQQQFGSASAIPNLSGLTSSLMQPGTSFQSLPGSRIPSPHSQSFQRKQNSSPQPFGRSSPSFQSPPPAHTKRSASVSSRHSREEESSSPVHQTTWSFEEQFKQELTNTSRRVKQTETKARRVQRGYGRERF